MRIQGDTIYTGIEEKGKSAHRAGAGRYTSK